MLPDEDAAEFAALEAALVEETGYGRRPEVEALEAEVPWRAEVMTASVLPRVGSGIVNEMLRPPTRPLCFGAATDLTPTREGC